MLDGILRHCDVQALLTAVRKNDVLAIREIADRIGEVAMKGLINERIPHESSEDASLYPTRVVTAMQVAAAHGHVAAMDVLLSYGANLIVRDPEGNIALHYAAKGAHLDAVRFLTRAMSSRGLSPNMENYRLDRPSNVVPKGRHTTQGCLSAIWTAIQPPLAPHHRSSSPRAVTFSVPQTRSMGSPNR